MVGITYRYAKGGMNALHGTQVDFIHGRGVFGGAVEHCDLSARCARLFQYVDGRLDITQRCHAGGEDD